MLRAELDEWYPGVEPRVVARINRIPCYVSLIQHYTFPFHTNADRAYRIRVIGDQEMVFTIANFKGGTNKIFNVLQRS
jgi:hypothetical protein